MITPHRSHITLPYFDPRIHRNHDIAAALPGLDQLLTFTHTLTNECKDRTPGYNMSTYAVGRLESLLSKAGHSLDRWGTPNTLTTQIYLTLNTLFGGCGDGLLESPSCATQQPLFYFLLAYVDMRTLGTGRDVTYSVSPADITCSTDADCASELFECLNRSCSLRYV